MIILNGRGYFGTPFFLSMIDVITPVFWILIGGRTTLPIKMLGSQGPYPKKSLFFFIKVFGLYYFFRIFTS